MKSLIIREFYYRIWLHHVKKALKLDKVKFPTLYNYHMEMFLYYSEKWKALGGGWKIMMEWCKHYDEQYQEKENRGSIYT
jgi:hypothetical protein